MANTFTSLHYHVIFSTKNRELLIHQDIEQRVWSYLGGIARENEMKALLVGGIENHRHLWHRMAQAHGDHRCLAPREGKKMSKLQAAGCQPGGSAMETGMKDSGEPACGERAFDRATA